MFPSLYNFLLKSPIHPRAVKGFSASSSFQPAPKSCFPFVKRYKNVSATENTISLFSSSRRQDVARVLSVSHVRFHFLLYNQSNMHLPGAPAMSQPCQRDLAAKLTWAALASTTQGKANNTWQYPSPSSTPWPFFHLPGYKNGRKFVSTDSRSLGAAC